MKDHQLYGPWAGMNTRPLPYGIQRRRQRVRIAFAMLTILVVIGCGLAALSGWEAPQI